jgi:hypothetical protein
MAYGAAKTHIELAAIERDLLGVYIDNGARRHPEIPGILDIDDNLGSSSRRNFANGAERLVSIIDEHIEAFADLLVHFLSSWSAG